MATVAAPLARQAAPTERRLATWRQHGFGVLRIGFGAIWAIDAWFKWQPGFIDNFSGYLTDAQQQAGQPYLVHHWIGFWINTVNVDPKLFAYFVAAAETVVALGLLLGVFSNLVYAAGTLLSIVIWSTAESFGGPYVAGSTDIGAAVIYVLVFASLFLSRSGWYYGLDRPLGRRLGRWSWVASGHDEHLRADESGGVSQ